MPDSARGGVKAVPVRKLISLLGAIVAIITAVCPPVSYAINNYWKEQASLNFRGELTAARTARFIRGAPDEWQADSERLANAAGIRGQTPKPFNQRLLGINGAVVLDRGETLSPPTTRLITPVVVNGATVGWVETVGTLQPLLTEVTLLALVTLGLGIAVYFAFTTLPLKALDRSLGKLEVANARFKEQNLILDTALTNMHQGLAMFDAEERLVFANDRYAELYGMTSDQLKPGTTLPQIAEYRIASGLYAGLTLDETLEKMRRRIAGKTVSYLTRKLSDGRTIAVTVRPRDDGGWVTTHEDVTEHERLNTRLGEQNHRLRSQEKALKAQNMILDAALETMSQGLCMFDAEQRVVTCNSRYAEMYGMTMEQVKPGTTLQTIIQHRIAKGLYSDGGPDEYMRQRMAPVLAPSNTVHELSDGRSIAIARRPMPDGGWVTTHEDVTESRRREARIAHMAHHDALTDLPNRILMNEKLEFALARARQGEVAACHLLDLDDFKNINDTLGHPAGDKLLRQVADRLRTLVRATDTIARMGGDEFAILQCGLAQPAEATGLAQRVIEVVSEPYDIDGHQVVIGTSIGIAMGPTDGATPDELIRNADLALYRAKGEGRGTFSFFEPEMDGVMQARRAMETDLRKAQAAGEFELLYQPVVNLATDEISGLEALIRWRHPQKGMIPPSDFITLAEEMGLIEPISEWVLRQACTRAAQWPADLKIAVNLSPAQFRRHGLVDTVISALAASGLPADRLELEITESSLLQNSEATLGMLYQLRELGVRIAMDDFGTGYSSLSYLQSFPFDKIKIDRSFVKDITDGVGSLNIVRAVTAMARGLGMTTTAEGVETPEQLEMIRAEGCTEMQGFLFSKPLSAHEVDELLRTHRRDREHNSAAA
jgi:diguanylate cyclase (GGDEF)-like protein/PAS domain S-box-containing protein